LLFGDMRRLFFACWNAHIFMPINLAPTSTVIENSNAAGRYNVRFNKSYWG
jgi:hypothetical protein